MTGIIRAISDGTDATIRMRNYITEFNKRVIRLRLHRSEIVFGQINDVMDIFTYIHLFTPFFYRGMQISQFFMI